MLFYRDSAFQSTFRRLCTACKLEDFRFPVSRSNDVSSRPDAHLSIVPSIRTTCHTIQTPDRPSIIRPDDVDFRLDPSLYREGSVLACIRPNDSAARPNASQSTKLQILSKIKYGNIAATVRTTWYPVRTRFSLRQVRKSNSTVRTLVCHYPDARSTNMEIACRRSTVRTAIILVRTPEALIRKLLAADVGPSGRQ